MHYGVRFTVDERGSRFSRPASLPVLPAALRQGVVALL
jgi:hypothetical protein